MSDLVASVDYSEFRALVKRLSGYDIRRAFNRGISHSVKIMQKQLQNDVRGYWPNSGGKKRHSVSAMGWFISHALWKDAKLSVWKDKPKNPKLSELGATLSLRSKKHYANRAHVLRWLNNGTKTRYTKRGKKRGRIGNKPYTNFFERSINASRAQAFAKLQENIEAAMKYYAEH